MAGSDGTVRSITGAEVDSSAGVLASAFSDDPIFEFILGDRGDIELRIANLFRDAAAAVTTLPASFTHRTCHGEVAVCRVTA